MLQEDYRHIMLDRSIVELRLLHITIHGLDVSWNFQGLHYLLCGRSRACRGTDPPPLHYPPNGISDRSI